MISHKSSNEDKLKHIKMLLLIHMVTIAGGGKGAVRKACDAILKARGLWEKSLERF